MESDPIGLTGGINTYGYVDSGQLAFGDRTGLAPTIGIAPSELFFPQQWGTDRCAQVQQKIKNLNEDIEKRYELIRTNPGALPQFGPGPNYTTVLGHYRVINKLDQDRRKLENDYDRHCRNCGCPPSSSPAGQPSTTPSTVGGCREHDLHCDCGYFDSFVRLLCSEKDSVADKPRKQKSAISIFDSTGAVVHRAYVTDPSQGLRGANLEGLVAPLAQLQGVDLTGAVLYWASLGDADLSFADLSRADLRGAMLYRTVCRGTKFCGANLGRDNLQGRTDIKGADLSTADLRDATLKDAVYDADTKFPSGFVPADVGMINVDDLPAGDPGRKQR